MGTIFFEFKKEQQATLSRYLTGCDQANEHACVEATEGSGSSIICIPKAKTCDKVPDCQDGSDELESMCGKCK